jgi:erythromycin esterase
MRPLLCVLLAACSTTPLPNNEAPDLGQAPAPDLAPSLPTGISALAGDDPSLPDDDLAPLGALIGDRATVGVGESIHTSGGFQLARARVIQYLVAKKGFRLIAIEWQRVSGDTVEAYLQSGTGSAPKAAQQLSVWSSSEVMKLLEWLRAWNMAHAGDAVHFMGFDVQQPSDDEKQLGAFFTAAAAHDATTLSAPLAKCDDGMSDTSSSVMYVGDYAACSGGLDAIDAYLTKNASALTAASSQSQFQNAQLAAKSLRAWQDEIYYYSTNVPKSYQARDDAMAAVYLAEKSQRFPGVKTIVWAHNYHLRMAGAQVTGDGAVGAPNMGTRLAAALADDYFPVGQVAFDIGIDWPGVGCGSQPPPTDSQAMPVLLNALPVDAALVDLSTGSLFAAGQSYAESDVETMIPSQQYRALIFLKHSPKMTPLDWPSCQ